LRRREGLSLVEVLVALVIVSIAASMFLYFADSLRLTREASQETELIAFSKNYLSSLQSYWQDANNYEFGLSQIAVLAHSVPESYSLAVTVRNEADEIILKYPEAESIPIQDKSTLRHLTLTFSNEQNKQLSMSHSFSFPPPRP